MFTRILYVLCQVLMCCTVSAQVYRADLMLGANFSQVDGDQMGGYNKLGINFGFAINREVKKDWQAGFELHYSQKGSKKILDPDIIDPALVLNYHYIEVPLLASYSYNKAITFFGGPAIGVNVKNQRIDNGLELREEELRPWELSLQFGGYYRFGEKLSVEIRHSSSFWSIRDYPFKANGPLWIGSSAWYNRLFTVGLRYDLGK